MAILRLSLPKTQSVLLCCLIACSSAGAMHASAEGEGAGPFVSTAQHGYAVAGSSSPGVNLNARVAGAYGQLPLAFTENRGQVDPMVRYTIRGPQASAFFTDSGVTLDLSDGIAKSPADGIVGVTDLISFADAEHRAALRMTFDGSRPDCRVEGTDELRGKVNILRGKDPSKWQTGIPTFRGVVYRDVWPGIDVSYHGDRQQLKYDIRVDPGADLTDIRLKYEGAEKIWLDRKGDLRIETAVTTFIETVPGIYQEKDGEKIAIKGGYVLLNAQTVGFRAKGVDPSLPLVIDPASDLVYSTLLGGPSTDGPQAIAVDQSGAAYVAGHAVAPGLPTTMGAFDTTYMGQDAFVTKLDPSGSGLVYSTFLGGSSVDFPVDIAVDAGGCAYVTGRTSSSDFPTTSGVLHASFAGSWDPFIAKLNPSGSGLVYSALFGHRDCSTGVAVDADGCAYVTGYSDDPEFPTTPGALGRTTDGSDDIFVTKLNPSASGLVYSALLGGSSHDYSSDIAIDADGCAYLTGSTFSPDFPTTPGAFDSRAHRDTDGFVAKLNPSGSGLIYSTYLGGSGDDSLNGIAVDTNGCAYLAGQTFSRDFPTTPGALDRSFSGYDAFAAKLNASGSALAYSTLLGGFGSAEGIAVDADGCACVIGVPYSPDFPTTPDAFDTSPNGNYDVFVAKLNRRGSGLVYSTLLGGPSQELARGVALGWDGSAYVLGGTHAPDFPTTEGAFDTSFNGDWDVFVAKFHMKHAPLGVNVSPISGTCPAETRVTLSTSYRDRDGYADLNTCYAILNPTLSAANSIELIYNQAVNKLFLQNDAGNSWLGGITPGTAGATIENSRCIVYCGDTTVNASGNDLTVNWKIAFKPTMTGKTCSAWLRVNDKGGLVDEWEKMTCSISVGGPPANVSVSPTSGSYAPGSRLTMSTSYSDPDGRTDLSNCYAIVNPTLSAANSIELIYNQVTNKLFLQNDAGNAWLGGVTPGTAGATIENSRCVVYCEETTTSGSGNGLTVNWRFALKPTMAGKSCGVWLRSTDKAGLVDEWEKLASGICVGSPPSNAGVSPTSGAYGVGDKFTFSTSYADPDGYGDLNTCYSILNPTLSAANSVELIYHQPTNKLYLQNDAGNSWLGGVTPGTSGATIENSRCIVYCDETTVDRAGNNTTVNWKISLKTPMAGKTCGAWLRVNDRAGLTDEWENMGASIGITAAP